MTWLTIRFIIVLIAWYTLVFKRPSAEVSKRQIERWGTDKQYKICWKLMTLQNPLKEYKNYHNEWASKIIISFVIWLLFIGSFVLTYRFIEQWV